MNETETSDSLTIILVRSGSTELDDQGRIVGSLDLPLSAKGIEEVQISLAELGSFPVSAVISAASRSAQQSAQMIAKLFRLRSKTEPRLTNLDCGLWHGRALDEFRETQPSLLKQWKESPEKVCPPEGETVDDVRKRVAIFLKKLLLKNRKGFVVIVAPEPLLGILQREIQPAASGEICPPLKPGKWRVLEPLVVA
jgi:broad specificity phosphatase PhoE